LALNAQALRLLHGGDATLHLGLSLALGVSSRKLWHVQLDACHAGEQAPHALLE